MANTVLITGSSTGFGKDTALEFARQGWNVVATMRTPQPLAHPNILVTRLDVQDRASIAHAVQEGIARFGAIDALINNAGFGLFGVFESTPRERIEQQFAVNVFGVMDVTRALLPHFRERRRGTIVNVSSGAGAFALPMISAYAASKFALEGFSESLSYELGAQNIRVKIVEPGGVLSTQFSARSAREAEHAAPIADYEPFMQHAQQVFADLRGARLATSEQVAQGIYAATTDASDRLRYVVTEDIEPLLKARRETSEDAYMALMRGQFASSR